MNEFQGRVGIQQRVLPSYRKPFFDALSRKCSRGLQVFAGNPRSDESIDTRSSCLHVAQHVNAANLHFGKGKTYLCWQVGLTQWLRSWQPDVLVMEANPRTLSNYQAIALMRLWRRPIIGWGLGYLDWSIPGWVLTGRKFILRRFYSLFDALVAYSSKGAEDYVRLGIVSDKVFVAPNAVSGEQAEEFYRELLRSPDFIDEWKHKLGLSHKPIVLYVGRLLPSKHVDDLIMACAPFTDSCELLIIGDGPERSRLEALAQQVFPNTRFLGHRTGRELAECFFGADLFVLPGTGGLAVQEAMIYGKPVIVGAGDGSQSDLVQEGVNGFLVSSADVPSLRCTIQSCLQHPERLRRMGSESRRIVHQQVNMDAMVRGFITALNSVGHH